MPIPSGDQPGSFDRAERWVLWILVALIVLGLCGLTGLAGWLIAPFTPFWANWLSVTQGRVEVIAPAESQPGGGKMSPDGHYMLLSWTRDGQREFFIWNLVTKTHLILDTIPDAVCWLNNNEIAALNSTPARYFLIDANSGTFVPVTVIIARTTYPAQQDLARLQSRWQSAEELYVLENFLISGKTIFTIEQSHSYVYYNFSYDQAIDQLLQDVPHTRISSPCGTPPGDVPLYSPDGRYYARLSTGTFGHVQIYTRDGALVADAWKDGWAPLLIGWAHDSSGVYFRTMIVGGAASVLAPYEPIFKLSPLRPEDQRAALMWRIAAWGAVTGAALGVAWWWRRRRRI